MPHVKLLCLTLALLTGVWVSAITYQRAQVHGYRFLRPIAHYTAILNLALLGLFFSRYLDLNLPIQFLKENAVRFRDLRDLAISVLVVGLLVSMLRVVLTFRNRDLPLLWRRCILAALAVLVIAYGARVAVPATGVFFSWLNTLRYYILENAIVLEIPLLVALLVQAAKAGDRARMMRTYAYLYLSRYPIVAAIVVANLSVGLPEPWRLIASLGALLYFNWIPLIWYRYSFWEYAKCAASAFGNDQTLAELASRYGLSQREGEVVRLILGGKSNKEIEDALCISIHTVKNHIYNIYQKLGVKSRYELAHLVQISAAPVEGRPGRPD